MRTTTLTLSSARDDADEDRNSVAAEDGDAMSGLCVFSWEGCVIERF